ncbi:MAG: methyl-accepting chemotaxis protein [Bdellovibrionota bacterium]
MENSKHPANPFRQIYMTLWNLLDRLPLRVKTLLTCGYTSFLAIVILFALLAGTVGPREMGVFQRAGWLGERFMGSGFIPAVFALLVVTLIIQSWANGRASRNLQEAIDRESAGKEIDEALIKGSLDELAVFPVKAATISLLLWIATALSWWIVLNWTGRLSNDINLFIAAGIFCEGFIAFPYQYYIFKLQTERDYAWLSERLGKDYFPERARFVTIRKKLGGSITVLVFFSLLALFASNLLLAWEGVRHQTARVGEQLLNASALGIAGIRHELEEAANRRQSYVDFLSGAEPERPVGEILLERAKVYLQGVEEKVGQHYYLFDETGRARHGDLGELPKEMFDQAIEGIRNSGGQLFLREESPRTQDLFLAAAVEWTEGRRWYLGTFYPRAYMVESIRDITVVSISLILVMIAVGLLTAFLIASDTSSSLNRMARVTGKASAGDLSSTSIRVISEDEVGALARSLTEMLGSFRGTLRSIETSSSNVDAATADIDGVARQVSGGAEIQVASSKETTQNMNVLTASIRSIGENVEVLARSAEESASSIFEMGTTIEGVAGNVSQLFDAVDDSTSVVTEMVASIRQVAESVETLSEIAVDTARSMEEMTQSNRQVEEEAVEARRLAEQTSKTAQAGALSVQQTIEGIQEIRSSVGAARGVIEKLQQSANAIGNILNYIHDVADQTNLLSLNAGIIAAQAGEHGKGFAVIAKEVSTLAERTARYTREIARLIETVQGNAKDAAIAMQAGQGAVDAGVDLSRRAGETLEKILTSAEQSSQRAYSIAATASDQTASAKRVSQAIDRASQMAQQIAKATQEQSRGSERILKAGEKVRDIAALVKKTTQEQAKSSKQITQSIENINDMVRYINESQREEVTTCDRVGQLVENINKVTLQNFDHSMNLDRAVEVLRRQSATLKAHVSRFKLSVNGNGTHPAKPDGKDDTDDQPLVI